MLNAGGFSSGFLGAGLTKALGVTSQNYDNLALLVLICNLSSLLPLPLLWRMVPSELDRDADEDSGNSGSGGAGAGKQLE